MNDKQISKDFVDQVSQALKNVDARMKQIETKLMNNTKAEAVIISKLKTMDEQIQNQNKQLLKQIIHEVNTKIDHYKQYQIDIFDSQDSKLQEINSRLDNVNKQNNQINDYSTQDKSELSNLYNHFYTLNEKVNQLINNKQEKYDQNIQIPQKDNNFQEKVDEFKIVSSPNIYSNQNDFIPTAQFDGSILDEFNINIKSDNDSKQIINSINSSPIKDKNNDSSLKNKIKESFENNNFLRDILNSKRDSSEGMRFLSERSNVNSSLLMQDVNEINDHFDKNSKNMNLVEKILNNNKQIDYPKEKEPKRLNSNENNITNIKVERENGKDSLIVEEQVSHPQPKEIDYKDKLLLRKLQQNSSKSARSNHSRSKSPASTHRPNNLFKIKDINVKNFVNIKIDYFKGFMQNGKFHVIGGCENGNKEIIYRNDLTNKIRIYRLNTLNQQEELQMARSINYRSGFGISLIENNLYIFGGHYQTSDSELISNEMYKINLSSVGLKILSCLTQNSTQNCAQFGNLINFNTKIQMIGGIASQSHNQNNENSDATFLSNQVSIQDTKKNNYLKQEKINEFEGRFDHSVTKFKSKFIIIAFGKNKDRYLYDINFFNIETINITKINLENNSIFYNYTSQFVSCANDQKEFDIMCLGGIDNNSCFQKLKGADFHIVGESKKIQINGCHSIIADSNTYVIFDEMKNIQRIEQ